MSEGTWLYAVTGDAPTPAGRSAVVRDGPSGWCGAAGPCGVAGWGGVAGEPVRTLACDGLTAVVGTVDLADFGEEPLRRSFADPDFVGRIARAHHDVVAALAAVGPAVPLRLATIYLGDERVRDFVASRREALAATLHRLAGHAEWGVKAYLTKAGSHPTEPDAATAGRSGRGYLLRRRQQLHLHEAAWARAVQCGDDIHAALSGTAAESVRHPVPADAQPDGERPVLRAAYLVATTAVDEFTRLCGALSNDGEVRFEVTGPWPAYSFVDTSDAG